MFTVMMKGITGFVRVGIPLMFEERVNDDLHSYSCASIRHTGAHTRTHTHTQPFLPTGC